MSKKEKRFRSVKTGSEMTVDDIGLSMICSNCDCKKTLLKLDCNRFTQIRVCTNEQCFHYWNIKGIPSWVRV